MRCLSGSGADFAFAGAMDTFFQAYKTLSPRLTAGAKLAAAGLLLTAPCELLLPAALLSRDVRSFFSLNWQIVKTGKVSVAAVSNLSWADRMVQSTRRDIDERLVLIGTAAMLGLVTLGYTMGALPLLQVAAFPLTRQLGTTIAGISMPQARAVFEQLRLGLDKMDQRAILEKAQMLAEAFDSLPSISKWELGAMTILAVRLVSELIRGVADLRFAPVALVQEYRIRHQEDTRRVPATVAVDIEEEYATSDRDDDVVVVLDSPPASRANPDRPDGLTEDDWNAVNVRDTIVFMRERDRFEYEGEVCKKGGGVLGYRSLSVRWDNLGQTAQTVMSIEGFRRFKIKRQPR